MGSLDDCARRASDLGYDALSLTVKDPNERDWVQVLRKLQNCGLEASGLATGRVYTVDGLGLGMADADRRRAAVDRMLAFLPVCAEPLYSSAASDVYKRQVQSWAGQS